MAANLPDSTRDVDAFDQSLLDITVEPRPPRRSLVNSGIVGTGCPAEPWRATAVENQLRRAVRRNDTNQGSSQGDELCRAAFWPGQRSA